jgi:hypothetical protein
LRFLAFILAFLLPAAASAGGFASPKGTWWSKVDYSSWAADGKFAGLFERDLANGVELGDHIEFDPSTGGSLDTQAVSLTTQFVPIDRLVLGLHLPAFQRVVFEDSTFISETTGVGDLRPSIGYQVTPSGMSAATIVALDAKIPLSSPLAGFETIPLSEGQYDFAVRQETSWAPVGRLMITGMTLFRRRTVFVDDDRRIKPGDEAEASLSIGGAPLSVLWLSAGLHGLWSTGSEDRSNPGAVSLRDRRQIQSFMAGAYLSFGRWLPTALHGLALDLSTRVPVSGQDYPSGASWAAGLAYEVDLY